MWLEWFWGGNDIIQGGGEGVTGVPLELVTGGGQVIRGGSVAQSKEGLLKGRSQRRRLLEVGQYLEPAAKSGDRIA